MKEQKPIYLTQLGGFILLSFAVAGALAAGNQPYVAIWKAITTIKELQKVAPKEMETNSCE